MTKPNQITRRKFLYQGTMAAGTICLSPMLFPGFSATAKVKGDFPLAILFNRSDIETLRARTKLPLFKNYWQLLLNLDLEKERTFIKEVDTSQKIEPIARLEGILQSMFTIWISAAGNGF